MLEGLRQAVPYLRLFRGKTFVVKVGGEAILKHQDRVRWLEQVSVLHQLGIRVVVVHGGGPQATDLAGRLGAEHSFVNGRRVTDEQMLEAMILALNGEVSTQILSTCRQLQIPAMGVSGIDAGLIEAKRRQPTGEADYGLVGDVQEVDPKPLNLLLDNGYVPILSPLCADKNGQVLNINADTVAARVAIALQASKLMLVTGARGVLADPNDPTSLISVTHLDELEDLESQGALKGGMLPKAASIALALDQGVEKVHVMSYEYPDSILTEVFTNEGCGTLILPRSREAAPC